MSAAVRSLALAIAALLAVGSLALAAPRAARHDEALEALLTAASEATKAAGSAYVTVDGRATTRVRLTNLDEMLARMPALDGFEDQWSDAPSVPDVTVPTPPEFSPFDCHDMPADQCDAVNEAQREAAERAVGEADGHLSDVMDANRTQLREQMEAQRRAMQDELAARLSEIPQEFSCTFTFSGSGPVTIPGAIDITGDANVECDPDVNDSSGSFGAGIAFGTGSGFPAGGVSSASAEKFVADPGDLTTMLESAEGVEDHGTEVIDGVEVRHLSFGAVPSGFGDGEGTSTVDVWIGVDDHIVRKAVMRSSGQMSRDGIETEWTAEQTMLVSDVRL